MGRRPGGGFHLCAAAAGSLFGEQVVKCKLEHRGRKEGAAVVYMILCWSGMHMLRMVGRVALNDVGQLASSKVFDVMTQSFV